jgi:hypothetical protein
VTPARDAIHGIPAGVDDPGYKGMKAACKGEANGSFFECSAQPIVSLANE